MKVGVRAVEVDAKEQKPKSLKVSLVFDPETAYQLNELALREGQPVGEMVRTLVVGSMAAYPQWEISAADRRRAFAEQKHAMLVNLYAWFNEQRWIMEHQIAEEQRERTGT
jgi:hypothetical protein